MSTAPPPAGPPPQQLPEPGSMRCPRCSSPIAPEQDWCLECGAPARTRLAPTPNWQLPTVAIGAIVAIAGALLAFAFVKLTSDDDVPAGTTPTAVVQTAPPAVITPPPAVTPTTPTASTTAPAQPAAPSTAVPGQTTAPTPGGATTPDPPVATPTPTATGPATATTP
ncbi:MAG: hypothetical protein Q8K79_05730 [Solirubrobacteraceae bacterium]|nr:hypothetical protein [Solirubrobacteraceae bacterium]